MRTTEEAIRQYKHICWYPSAGRDFRPLLFLSDWYCRKNGLDLDEGQEMPDLYIFTDYVGFPVWFGDEYEKEGFDFLKPGFHLIENEYYSNSTKITIKCVERLVDFRFSFDRNLACMDSTPAYNSSFLMEVEVESKLEGVVTTYDATVLYITAFNETLYREFILRHHIKVEYQVLVRYGEGMGGGARIHPSWIIRSYRELGTKYLISELRYVEEAREDESTDKPMPVLEKIYSINAKQWSQHDAEIGWHRVIK